MDTGTVTNRSAISMNPRIPRTTGIAWRLAPLADRRGVDVFIRLFGASALPVGANRGRLATMGLPADVTEHALRRVRSVRDWDLAWTWAAQRFLGEGRVHQRVGQEDAAALSQQHAALAYHLAGMLVFDDPRKIRALRASASSLYARSLPVLRPAVRRVEAPWRTTHLPGYLALPENRVWPGAASGHSQWNVDEQGRDAPLERRVPRARSGRAGAGLAREWRKLAARTADPGLRRFHRRRHRRRVRRAGDRRRPALVSWDSAWVAPSRPLPPPTTGESEPSLP